MKFSTGLLVACTVATVSASVSEYARDCRGDQKVELKINGKWTELKERDMVVSYKTELQQKRWFSTFKTEGTIQWKCGNKIQTENTGVRTGKSVALNLLTPQLIRQKIESKNLKNVEVFVMYDREQVRFIFQDYNLAHDKSPQALGAHYAKRFNDGIRPIQCCANADLSNQTMSGLNLHNVDFTNANLNNVNFKNSDLTGALFENATMNETMFSPQIEKNGFQLLENIIEGQLTETELKEIEKFASSRGLGQPIKQLVELAKTIKADTVLAKADKWVQKMAKRAMFLSIVSAVSTPKFAEGSKMVFNEVEAKRPFQIPGNKETGKLVDGYMNMIDQQSGVKGLSSGVIAGVIVSAVTALVASGIYNFVKLTLPYLPGVIPTNSMTSRCRFNRGVKVLVNGKWEKVKSGKRLITFIAQDSKTNKNGFNVVQWKCGSSNRVYEQTTMINSKGLNINVAYDGSK
eukprot:Pgem_evm1s1531